jgi:tripartite ATP-independent transporter DctP family solute receptor
MGPTSRRTFLGLGAAAGASMFNIGKLSANPPEFTYKWATNLAPSHSLNIRGLEAVERIKNETGGRLVIDVYPNNQLGADTDLLSQVRSGAIEFYTISPVLAATIIPAAAISGIGFAFKDAATAFTALDGDLGQHIRDEVGKTQIMALDRVFELGFRQVTTSTRPITRPDDLKGVKLRVPPGPLYNSLFLTLGASPITINFSEVYSALQTKIADGQDNPLVVVQTQKFYEVQKYCSLTNHIWDGQWPFANRKAFEALPPKLQDIVRANFAKAAEDQRADVARANVSIVDELKAKGITFNTTDGAEFKKALQAGGYYKQWREKFGDTAWKLLERYAGDIS